MFLPADGCGSADLLGCASRRSPDVRMFMVGGHRSMSIHSLGFSVADT